MSDTTDFFVSKFRESIGRENEPGRYFRPRPYRNASVRFRSCSIDDFDKRKELLLNEAGLNAFLFRSDMIPGCDLLSDSGTTTMTAEQWAAMMLGDEAYGSNEGYFELVDQISETFGSGWGSSERMNPGRNLFIFHQGRAAENALFSILKKTLRAGGGKLRPVLSERLMPELKGRIEAKTRSVMGGGGRQGKEAYIIPSNSHFDTTQGNIEDKEMVPLNLPCPQHLSGDESFHFRGNMDTDELENLLASEGDRIPLVYLTITNNTVGGQPVSMSNIRKIREITDSFDVPFFFDACRFAENAWFIKMREEGYQDMEIGDIVREMFGFVDGFHISLKKDGLVNIGGALVLKEGGRFLEKYSGFEEGLTDYQIMVEGHPTYGGMAGRDLRGVVRGLKTVVRKDYLDARIGQVRRFGEKLAGYGIPIIRPTGGHAIYIDMDRFFDGSRMEEFMGISVTALLLIAGHRVCELGTYAFGEYDGEKEIPPNPRVNYVRAAVPRLAYEDSDLFSAAESVKVLFDNRQRIPGVKVEYGRELSLRHFKSIFSFK